MSITVPSEFHLPIVTTGPAFSIAPRRALGDDGKEWTAVQGAALEALEYLSRDHGRDGVAWFCAVLPPEEDAAEGHRLGVVFAFPGEVTDAEMASLEGGLSSITRGWTSEGVRTIPRRAFPSIALKEGVAYQLWVEGRRGLSAPRLVLEEGELLPTRMPAATAGGGDFLEHVQHAVGVSVAQEDGIAADPIEVYKVVFALSVCERILEADGEIAESEVEFLRRTFPSARLERLGLLDRVRFLILRQSATDELADHLVYDAKLALMGLFWRAGQSDGYVDATELSILREAAAQLQLDWGEVEAYLHEIW